MAGKTAGNRSGMNRRQFVTRVGAAGVGTVAATAALNAQDDNAKKILATKEELIPAEKIMGLDYSDEERALIFDGIEEMVDRVRTRRAQAPLDNADAPALTFDPRLKGRKYHEQENRVILSQKPAGPLPSRDEDIAFAPVTHLMQWIKSGAITSERLTEIYLKRIADHGPKLECFVTVTADTARKQARAADAALARSDYKGPLHGIPYGMKDLADTANIETSWGAAPYKGRTPEKDAVIVERLRGAGAVLLGKTTLGALAYGDKWFGGVTRNPWSLNEGSSGSSAGSASATVAGLVGFSIGTETLGSIVSPSTRNGATGLRPTFGRVPRTGAMALCWSLDKFGPICRYAEDTALVLAAINGDDDGDPSALDWGFQYDASNAAKDLTIGYNKDWFGENAKASDRAALEKLREFGFTLKEITVPEFPVGALLTTLEAEASAAFEELTLSDRDDLLTWQQPQAWPNTFRQARLHSAVEAIQVDRMRRKIMIAMDDLYKDIDLIISPNFAGGMLLITNYTGHPSLTLPIGFEDRATAPLTGVEGAKPGPAKSLPHTITLWGNMFREDQLIGVGRMLEEAFGAANRHPSLG